MKRFSLLGEVSNRPQQGVFRFAYRIGFYRARVIYTFGLFSTYTCDKFPFRFPRREVTEAVPVSAPPDVALLRRRRGPGGVDSDCVRCKGTGSIAREAVSS